MKASHESNVEPLAREELLGVLQAMAPVPVPADWWLRPGAPGFKLGVSTTRSDDEPWTYTATLIQQQGTDIGNVRGRFAGDLAEAVLDALDFTGKIGSPQWKIPDWHPDARTHDTMERDAALGIGPTEFAIELRFWWDGGDRTLLFVWPATSAFQKKIPEERHPQNVD